MKQYKVIILSEAQRDLEKRIDYIVYVLKNKQAAKSVMLDYNNTIKMLSNIADSGTGKQTSAGKTTEKIKFSQTRLLSSFQNIRE